jgi:2,4-dienoyl-CoA reductase (NADPH2)
MQTSDDLACAVNPFSGREHELEIPRGNRKLVVIGGGTGGLEAARQAAEAGHKVVLFEKQRRLGGSLTLASTVHSDNERFLSWLLAEVERLGVDVCTGCNATVGIVMAENPDAVIVSTGARVKMPEIPGIEQAHVLTGALLRQVVAGELQDDESWRLPRWLQWFVEKGIPLVQRFMSPALMRRASKLWMPIGEEVVIVGVDLVAVELAEFLAHRGRKVHLVDSSKKITISGLPSIRP